MRKIALIMAMASEAAPIVSRLGLREASSPWNAKLPMRLYRGPVGGLDVTLTLCGTGAVPGERSYRRAVQVR